MEHGVKSKAAGYWFIGYWSLVIGQ